MKLSKNFYVQTRKNLAKKLKANSVSIINSNPLFKLYPDCDLHFKQNSDLIYFSGISQPNTTLLIIKESDKYQEILFVYEQSQKEKLWLPPLLEKEQISELTGIKEIYNLSEFDKLFKSITNNKSLYINFKQLTTLNKNYEGIYSPFKIQTIDNTKSKIPPINKDIFTNTLYKKYNITQFLDLYPLISSLRCIKSQEEISYISEACEYTNKAYQHVMRQLKSKKYEYELEAEFIYKFTHYGCQGFAYDPIIASGKNACILHYTSNNSKLNNGDLVLIDVGVNYKNYNSDITRTLPIDGEFSKRQKEVYNAVLFVLQQAKKIIKPGLSFDEYKKQIALIMQKKLLELNLLTREDITNANSMKPAYRKYFMHGISHQLGIDVHDATNDNMPISEGMVITIEPGIYIPNENIGIRIENDVLITPKGIKDLSQNIPIEIEEIEYIINN